MTLKMPTFLSALSTLKVKQKTIYLETAPDAHFCPCCGFRMHSRGTKNRKINHPILQDNYKLVLILKQRRWRCTNPDYLYDISDSFKFVSKNRRTTNATDMLIVDAYRNLAESSASISKRFHVSDTYAHDVFDLSLIHISEPTRLGMISYAVFCLKKKKTKINVSDALQYLSPRHKY